MANRSRSRFSSETDEQGRESHEADEPDEKHVSEFRMIVAEGEQQADLVADQTAAEPEHHRVDPVPRGVVIGYAQPAGDYHHREAVPEMVKVYSSAYYHVVGIYRREAILAVKKATVNDRSARKVSPKLTLPCAMVADARAAIRWRAPYTLRRWPDIVSYVDVGTGRLCFSQLNSFRSKRTSPKMAVIAK